MRQLLDLLRAAIAHANANEPQPSKRRDAVLFWLKIEVEEQRRAHDYKAAFLAMTLIRLLRTEETINPIWKALVAVSKDEAPGVPPPTNRGVRSPSQDGSHQVAIDNDRSRSSAVSADDLRSYGALSDFIGSIRR
jgi:hypothetical protein